MARSSRLAGIDGQQPGSIDLADEDTVGSEPWSFESIHLVARAGLPMVAEARITITIEADLLGFVVEQSVLRPTRRLARTRRSFAPTLGAAIVEAGQLVHERLSAGYVVLGRTAGERLA